MPGVSVIIPWRDVGCDHRQRSLQWVLRRYETQLSEWEVALATEGSDEGDWRKADAIVRGAEKAKHDVLVVTDGDLWCDAVVEAVEAVSSGCAWAVPHKRTFRFTPEATEKIWGGVEPADLEDERHWLENAYNGVAGGGIVVVRRETVFEVPPDKRFRGWGGEDECWGLALDTLVGRHTRLRGHLWHLWHPPQSRRARYLGSVWNSWLQKRYRVARGRKARMRQLVEGGRMDYESMLVKELRPLAEERGIEGYAVMRKADLIEALERYDVDPPTPTSDTRGQRRARGQYQTWRHVTGRRYACREGSDRYKELEADDNWSPE